MTQPPAPRLNHRVFGINHYICPAHVGLVDFLDTAAAHGFAGIGLTERALEEMPLAQLRRELAARDLGVTSVNSAGYFLNDDAEAARRQAERNRWLIECSAELQAAALNVIVGGLGQARGTLTLEQARLRASEALAALHRDVVKADLKIIVEPMHPLGLWIRGCYNSLRQVEDAIRGMSNALINLDLYHSWWDPDLLSFIERDDSPLGMIQLCDVGNFGNDGMARRIPPGEGVIDLAPLLDACLRRVRRPILEVELFAIQLPDRALGELLGTTVDYLNALSGVPTFSRQEVTPR
jgi:sugar phosphate isomerase/epimerase